MFLGCQYVNDFFFEFISFSSLSFIFKSPLLFPVPLPGRVFVLLQWGSFFFIFVIRLLF